MNNTEPNQSSRCDAIVVPLSVFLRVIHRVADLERWARMKVVVIIFLSSAFLLGCALKPSRDSTSVSDVSLVVEGLEYRFDSFRTWGTDSAGKGFEWRYDIFRFRVIAPQAYRDQEWQITLPSSLETEHLSRIPDPKAKISIRIDSEALKKMLDPSPPETNQFRWPTLSSKYVFPEKSEPNQPPQRNAGSRPFLNDSSASETPSSLGPRG